MKPQFHAASSIVKGFNQTIKLFNEYFAGRKNKGTVNLLHEHNYFSIKAMTHVVLYLKIINMYYIKTY